MRLSDSGRKLIQGFEGLSLKAYRDADGYSIGYGHFLGKEPGLASRVIDRDEAERLFDQDVVKYETAVALTTPNALQREFDAMTSLAYNIGTGDTKTGKNGFAGSTVARLHNAGDKQGAADAFRMWKKSEGKDNPVLIARREKERNYYLTGSTSGALPLFPVPAPAESAEPPSPYAQYSAPYAPSPEPLPDLIPPEFPPSSDGGQGWGTPTIAAAGGASTVVALALGWVLYRLFLNR